MNARLKPEDLTGVDTLLVGRSGDVLIVGRKPKTKPVDVINTFQGEEAEELYLRLITVKKTED